MTPLNNMAQQIYPLPFNNYLSTIKTKEVMTKPEVVANERAGLHEHCGDILTFLA